MAAFRRFLPPALLLCCAPLACAHAPGGAESAEGYRRILREHPDDPDAAGAKEKLADLEFERASKLHTVLAYKKFLEEFGDSSKASVAQSRLEALRFNAAKDEGTSLAYRQFLRDHPDGAHRAEVEKLLADAEVRELAALGDKAELARLASKRRGDEVGDAAGEKLDAAAFADAQAHGARGLFQYVRQFPAGAHREEAQVALLAKEIDSLLFAGRVMDARELAGRNPLSQKIGDLEARFDRADAEAGARRTRQEGAQAALAGYYLRSVEDLAKALSAPDPLDRWQAAEELGQQVTPDAIDPLLRALRDGRNALLRQRAFDSLGQVLEALPPQISDFAVASRAEALSGLAATPEIHLAIAALLDLSGHLDEAAPEYQQAYDPALPDPVILRRWARVRMQRREVFSAAVAARHLSLWAMEIAKEEGPGAEGYSPLVSARDLCAAAGAAAEAAEIISKAREQKTEFPEDLQQFASLAAQTKKLADARLQDAEVALKVQEPMALGCADRRIAERISAAAESREKAVRALPKVAPALAPVLLRVASETDPSPRIRDRARAMLESRVGKDAKLQ